MASKPPTSQKHRRVYHLTTAEHGISDIALARLKIARFNDLNDPFELLSHSFKFGWVRALVSELKEDLSKKMGLLSFCEDWVEPLMWSHYASRHRGMCLGFDVYRKDLRPMGYVDSRQVLAAPPTSELEKEQFREQFLDTKYGGWRYEREHRILVPLAGAHREGSLYFFAFSKNLRLAEVILGPACELDLNQVRELVRKRHGKRVDVFKSRLEFKGFHVVPDEHTI